MYLVFLVLLIGSYLLGSIPFGYLVSKGKNVNIREIGSGNIGATNVYRALGMKWAVLVGLLDLAKGAIPTLLAIFFLDSEVLILAVGIAAIAGHNWPVFLGFKGGRGVATTGGVVLVLMPLITLIAVLIWVVLVKTTRYVSLGSVAVAVVYPVMAFFLEPRANFIFILFLAAVIIFQHRPNIKRLLAGEENKV